MFKKTWILWSRTQETILGFGNEVQMKEYADHYNRVYQTDEYVAVEFKGE